MVTSVVKQLPKSTVEIEIKISWDEIKSSYDKIFTKVSEGTEIHGFRKGKAPKELVQKQIDKAKLYEEVLKLFHTGHAIKSFQALREYRLLEHLFPEVTEALEHNEIASTFLHLAMQNTDERIARDMSVTSPVTVVNVIISLILAFALCLILAKVYSFTHRGVSYSQSFIQTVVVMGITVSLIMIIIGSNIARAFSLVGALSIIRFRNAVKDSRDVGFIFMAMAIGMACGTHFYMVAVVATALLSAVIVIMYNLEFGAKEAKEVMIRVQMPATIDHKTSLEDLFKTMVNYFALVSIDALDEGRRKELLYVIEPKKSIASSDILSRVSKIGDNVDVGLIVGQDSVDL